MIREAIELHVTGMREDGLSVPEPSPPFSKGENQRFFNGCLRLLQPQVTSNIKVNFSDLEAPRLSLLD